MNNPDLNIEVIEKPDEDLIRYFDEKISQFNLARWEVKVKVPLAVKLTDASGNIIAGAAAKTFGLWMILDNLWVSEDLRGQNIGSKILFQLEEAARKRGCRYVLLDTLNFQARPFYEKYGYKLEWTQENYPKTGCKYFMTKNLEA